MKRALFIVNPKSGKANIRTTLLGVTDVLTKSDYLTTVYITQKAKDATEIVQKMGMEYDLLVCAGGDGTLDEIVEGVMRLDRQIPIGYIPSGSTNDFAKSLGIPFDNIEAAMAIANGTPFLCDAGLFNESYFTYVAAFGAFTEVSYSTPQQTKNVLGHLAYILEGAKSLPFIQSYPICVKYKNTETGQVEVLEDDIILGMVTNSIMVGGMKRYKEEQVAFDDGLFEVILIRNPKNMIELNSILGALLLNDLNSEYIHYFKTESLKFSSNEEINWTLDGEFGGSLKEAEITNIKQGFTIYRNMGIQG